MTPIGIDIAKRKFDVAALLGEKYKSKVFENSPEGFKRLLAWLGAFPEPHVCLEATGRYGEALATFLADSGVRVSVVNPASIAAFANAELSRGKTDKSDAKRIARFCRSQQPRPWQPQPLNVRQLQALARRLENLLEMQQMERNRLEGADAQVQASLQAVLTTLEAQIEATRRKIRDHIDNDPDLCGRRDLLSSIPGVGEATVSALLAALGEPSRFERARQVVAFAGLNPKPRESGAFKGKSRLSKTGEPRLRKALYMPALVAWRHNPMIRSFCERLKARGMPAKAVIAAAMRKLLSLAFAILKSGTPFDPTRAVAA